MEKKAITLTTRLSRADVAGLMDALAESLKEGELTVQKSAEECRMQVPDFVDFEVHAAESDDGAFFRMEVSWRPRNIPDDVSAPGQAPRNMDDDPDLESDA